MTERPIVFACDWPQVLRHLGGQVFLICLLSFYLQFYIVYYIIIIYKTWNNCCCLTKFTGNAFVVITWAHAATGPAEIQIQIVLYRLSKKLFANDIVTNLFVRSFFAAGVQPTLQRWDHIAVQCACPARGSPDWCWVLRQPAASQVYLLGLTPARQADFTLLDKGACNGHSL